jgi:guanylate kinase
MFEPLIISGPSGIGKTYLEKHLIENHNFKRIMSTTTRQPREGEENMVDYHFVSETHYKVIESSGGFITSSNHLNAWYGFEKNLVEEIQNEKKVPITIVIPTIVSPFLNNYPDTHAIYLQPHSMELTIKRMKLRGDSDEKIKHRVELESSQTEYFEKNIKHLYKKILIVREENFEHMVHEILNLYT